MQTSQTARIRYFGVVKHLPTTLLSALALLFYCGAISELQGIGPKVKNDPATNKAAADALPESQEATEESVLPEEPTLSTPTPTDEPAITGLPVQPLPSGDISQPTGPTVDQRRKASEAFRAAKTEAEEQATIADIKLRAFAASTEREKRALLREYYQTISSYITKRSAELKDRAEAWSYQMQNRVGRSRTEPDYQPPAMPAAMVAAAAAKANSTPGASPTTEAPQPTPGDSNSLFPAIGN